MALTSTLQSLEGPQLKAINGDDLYAILETQGLNEGRTTISQIFHQTLNELDQKIRPQATMKSESGFMNEMRASFEIQDKLLNSVDISGLSEPISMVIDKLHAVIDRFVADINVFNQGLTLLRSPVARPSSLVTPNELYSLLEEYDLRISKYVAYQRILSSIETMQTMINHENVNNVQKDFGNDIVTGLKPLIPSIESIDINGLTIVQGQAISWIKSTVDRAERSINLFIEGFEFLGTVSRDHDHPENLESFISQYNPDIIKYLVRDELKYQITLIETKLNQANVNGIEKLKTAKSDAETLLVTLDSIRNILDQESKNQANATLQFIVERLSQII